MMNRGPNSALSGVLSTLVLAGAFGVAGCQADIAGQPGIPGAGAGAGVGASGSAGSGGTSGTGVGGTAGTSGVSGTGGGVGATCVGTYVTTPKRLVRLSSNQVVNAYAYLLNTTVANMIAMAEDIPAPTFRAFPPLAAGGTSIGDTQFALLDRMGQAAMAHVTANLGTFSGCGMAPTDACGQQFLMAFAEKAFRRPLTEPDRAAITTELWTEMLTDGATVSQAIQYGVYGILSSPHFLYRTEFGDNPAAQGPLTPYEIASELAFFVTDAPPDAELLAAAAANQLATGDQIRAQITRLLATPAARTNLEAAMVAYFQLPLVPVVVVDPASVPGITVTGGLQASMFHEGELFIKNTLWNGPLSDLLTSRRTWVTEQIATGIYGVAAPAPGTLDADMFGPIELGADRSGLLTLSPFLLAKTRPDAPSVVGRGLAINAALLCQDNPVFPEGNLDVEAGIAASAGFSQKGQADFRAERPTCSGCHAQFDAFGLALENYDSLGRYRTTDLQNRPIDVAWTTSVLPEVLWQDTNSDGITDPITVTSAAEMARAVVASGALNACMAMNLMNFALADVSQGGAGAPTPSAPTSSCAVTDVVNRFNTTDKSFVSLIREIAASETLAIRSGGI